MTTTERWERRLGVRQDLQAAFVQWDADPAAPGSGHEAELRELSVSGAAVVAPFDPAHVVDADVVVGHGEATGTVRIRRVERIGLDEIRLYAIEFIDPNPALANELYGYLYTTEDGKLLDSWHGRYVD